MTTYTFTITSSHTRGFSASTVEAPAFVPIFSHTYHTGLSGASPVNVQCFMTGFQATVAGATSGKITKTLVDDLATWAGTSALDTSTASKIVFQAAASTTAPIPSTPANTVAVLAPNGNDGYFIGHLFSRDMFNSALAALTGSSLPPVDNGAPLQFATADDTIVVNFVGNFVNSTTSETLTLGATLRIAP